MKNLHKIEVSTLTPKQLGIANYYNNVASKLIFYSDGRVEVIRGTYSQISWAKWNNEDWLPYIKNKPIRPLSKLNIIVERRI